MEKYTIKDLKDGKVALIFSSKDSRGDLQRVMGKAFPDVKTPVGNAKYYYRAGLINWQGSPVYGGKLPVQNLEIFLKELDMKDSRFPFELSPDNAEKIIDSACKKWQERLANEWAVNIILDKSNIISASFYKEMREACTQEQYKIFDEIFGKDTSIIEWHPGKVYRIEYISGHVYHRLAQDDYMYFTFEGEEYTKGVRSKDYIRTEAKITLVKQ